MSYSLIVFTLQYFELESRRLRRKSFVVKPFIGCTCIYYPNAAFHLEMNLRLTANFINSNYSSATCTKNHLYTCIIKIYQQRFISFMINVPVWILCKKGHLMKLKKSYDFIINSFVHADPLSVGKRWMSLAPRRFL